MDETYILWKREVIFQMIYDKIGETLQTFYYVRML